MSRGIYVIISKLQEHLKSLLGAGRHQVGALCFFLHPQTLQTPNTAQQRGSESRRDAASDAHAGGGGGPGDASVCWPQHRADPKGSLSLPPSLAALDRAGVPPWWV